MKLIHEIFNEIESTKSVNEKKDILLNNNNPTVLTLLKHMFDKSIKFGYDKLPEWTPSDDPTEMSMTNLYRESSKMHLLYEDNTSEWGPRISERHLVRLLEGLHPKDAMILSKIIMRKLKVSGLTERLVKETFPELLKNEQDKT